MATKSHTYYNALYNVYKKITVDVLQDWLKCGDKTGGVLNRLDFIFGWRLNVDDKGEISNLNNTGRVTKKDVINNMGLLPLLFDEKNNDPEFKILRNEIFEVCKQVKIIVTLFLVGDYKTSYDKFEELMRILNDENKLPIVTIKVDEVFFRMRSRRPDEAPFKPLDLFHVPFTKRNLIKSYRFSLPGYPCLYLSKSMYSCWEEMRRPALDSFFYAGFKTIKNFKLLDLRIRQDVKQDEEIEKYIQMLPIALASTMQVKEDGRAFVPEYIIPQLISKWVLAKYRQNMLIDKKVIGDCIIGLNYSSAMEDVWFEFSNNPDTYSLVDNLAILTIIKNDQVGLEYCDEVSSLFEMTKPHCYEYEYIKNTAEFFNKAFKRHQYSAEDFLKYKDSYLSFLEDRIIKSDEWTRIATYIQLHKETK